MSKLSFFFWDVQHGHSTYIRTPNDRHIVVDLGIGDYSLANEEFSPLKHLHYAMGVQQLDYVIITHPHLDHIDDVLNFDLVSPKVLHRPKHLSNEEVMAGVRLADKLKFDKYCEINTRYNQAISANSVNNPSNEGNWGDVRIKSFLAASCPRDNFNNHSIITVLTYRGVKVVIPGDNEQASFDELMLRDDFKSEVRDSYVLLAPHHGRYSGFVVDFVELVNPYITIVSDGRFCDTSANGRYSAKSSGWTVTSRSTGQASRRKCLTTNSDGHIEVNIGASDNGGTYLEVLID
jgi:competence protein ComEC